MRSRSHTDRMYYCIKFCNNLDQASSVYDGVIQEHLTLLTASKHQWVKHDETQLPARPKALCVINKQLWCCCGDAGVVVLSGGLGTLRTIPPGDRGRINDVCELTGDKFAIATSTGLYLGDAGSRIFQTIASLLQLRVTDVPLAAKSNVL